MCGHINSFILVRTPKQTPALCWNIFLRNLKQRHRANNDRAGPYASWCRRRPHPRPPRGPRNCLSRAQRTWSSQWEFPPPVARLRAQTRCNDAQTCAPRWPPTSDPCTLLEGIRPSAGECCSPHSSGRGGSLFPSREAEARGCEKSSAEKEEQCPSLTRSSSLSYVSLTRYRGSKYTKTGQKIRRVLNYSKKNKNKKLFIILKLKRL